MTKRKEMVGNKLKKASYIYNTYFYISFEQFIKILNLDIGKMKCDFIWKEVLGHNIVATELFWKSNKGKRC